VIAVAANTVVLATRNAAKLRELARILGVGDPGGTQVKLVDLDEFPGAPDVPETGATFEENALLKARAIADYTGLPAVADDSGLCVDALSGMPGVLSARWAGGHGDDKANLDLVLAQVADVPDTRLAARFVCAAALVVPASDPADSADSPHSRAASGDSRHSRAASGDSRHSRAASGDSRHSRAASGDSPHSRAASGDSPHSHAPREWVVTGQVTGRLVRVPRGSGGFGYDPIFLPDGFEQTTAEMTAEAKDAISHRGRAFRALTPFITAAALSGR